jgi:hypothetical protein
VPQDEGFIRPCVKLSLLQRRGGGAKGSWTFLIRHFVEDVGSLAPADTVW